jgi:hypothetical protein
LEVGKVSHREYGDFIDLLSFLKRNQHTDFHEIDVNVVPVEDIQLHIFNFLPSLITIWWMHELVGWKQH